MIIIKASSCSIVYSWADFYILLKKSSFAFLKVFLTLKTYEKVFKKISIYKKKIDTYTNISLFKSFILSKIYKNMHTDLNSLFLSLFLIGYHNEYLQTYFLELFSSLFYNFCIFCLLSV